VNTQPELLATETPMSDRIQHFWSVLSEKNVHIQLDIQRDHDDGSVHYDCSTFGDAVAKALVAERCAPAQQTLTPDLMNCTTVSCTGKDITIACDDHGTKDALMNILTDAAYAPAQPQPSGEPVANEIRSLRIDNARLRDEAFVYASTIGAARRDREYCVAQTGVNVRLANRVMELEARPASADLIERLREALSEVVRLHDKQIAPTPERIEMWRAALATIPEDGKAGGAQS
jgi:hypothetical protein